MPNHIENELTAPQDVIDSLAGNNGIVDFGAVTPMPELLEGDSACHINDWAEVCMGTHNLATLRRTHANAAESFMGGNYGAAADALHQSNLIRQMTDGPFPLTWSDADFEMLIRRMRCIRQFGKVSWYEWSIENWGTKWNAYQCKRIHPGVVRFQTAWSCPLPVIVALSKKFATDTIRIRWASEDFGRNVGDVTFRNGEVVAGDRLENDTEESHRLAFELVHDGEMPEDMQWVNGKLTYIEDAVTA